MDISAQGCPMKLVRLRIRVCKTAARCDLYRLRKYDLVAPRTIGQGEKDLAGRAQENLPDGRRHDPQR